MPNKTEFPTIKYIYGGPKMKKRLLAFVLCLFMLSAFIPATPAQAQVLSGNTSKIDYDNTDPNRYVIEIDLVNQIITVYEYQIGGTIVLQSLCTTGNAENPTNAGTFKLGSMKERFGYFVAFGQYAQYWTQVVRGIYIHSVMYNSKNTTSMSRTAYKQLGQNVSHGCVRVLPHIAQWIFYNCPPGTTCKVDRKKAADPALVKKLKAGIPAYNDYKQPKDSKPDPAEIPAISRYDNVPVRTGFSASRDKTVATLSRGQKMTLLQIASDWCKVKLQNGTLGYVKTEYLLFYPDAPVQTHSTYTATSKTYVYESMSTSAKRLATIPKGGEATVQSNPKQGWWYGSYNGVTGYMRTKYVTRSTGYVYPSLTGGAAPSAGNSSPGLGGSSLGGSSLGGSSLGSSSLGGSNSTNNSGSLSSSGSLGGSGSLSGSGTSAPKPAETTPANGPKIKEGTQARMRSAANTNANVVTLLPGGTAVTVLSVSGSWYYCQANGFTGYVHKSCFA